MEFAVFFLVGYLLGSVPFGVIAGRFFAGVDVREHGSGNIGMANVLRTVGVWAAVLVMALDMGKVALAVVLGRVFTDSPGVDAVSALGAMAGHSWPVFIGFKGGRGAATGLGALYVLAPISGLITTVVVVTVIATTRYVSLGSILGAVTGGIVLAVLALMGAVPSAYIWFAIIGTLLIVARHRSNVKRLVHGEERKIGQPADRDASKPESGRGKGLKWPRSA